ncbi:MAG: hypothetical protein GXX96_36840 [Planctomycetaceae bacterium]|jgi:hypothetical protein|nr:hypothetical protein [Planctomycetaceae bacterium]
MQPISETSPEGDTPVLEPHKSARILAEFPDLFPVTVFLWVLSVATIGTIVGLFCTEFFAGYTSLLRNLISN